MMLGTEELEQSWKSSERWAGILRPYGGGEVDRLRGTIDVRHTLAERGSEKLWKLLNSDGYVAALGALTGNQAIQQVGAGLPPSTGAGGQAARAATTPGQRYPAPARHPPARGPNACRRI